MLAGLLAHTSLCPQFQPWAPVLDLHENLLSFLLWVYIEIQVQSSLIFLLDLVRFAHNQS